MHWKERGCHRDLSVALNDFLLWKTLHVWLKSSVFAVICPGLRSVEILTTLCLKLFIEMIKEKLDIACISYKLLYSEMDTRCIW